METAARMRPPWPWPSPLPGGRMVGDDKYPRTYDNPRGREDPAWVRAQWQLSEERFDEWRSLLAPHARRGLGCAGSSDEESDACVDPSVRVRRGRRSTTWALPLAGFRLAGASAPAQPLPACYAATRPFRV